MVEKAFVMNLNETAANHYLLGGPPQTFGMRAGKVYLQPGETVGEHRTGKNGFLFFSRARTRC